MQQQIATRRMIGGADPWRIVRLDRLIDRVTFELHRRERANPYSAADMHRAFAKHPDLTAMRDGYYQLRGQEQEYRDRMANKEWERAERARKRAEALEFHRRFEAAKCPTCGHHTLAP